MTTSRAVVPPGGSKPVGVYSPAVVAPWGPGRSFLSISGQVPVDAEGVVLRPGDPAGQAEVVFDRIEELLAAAGGGLEHLVSVVVYLTRREDFNAVSQVRNRRLGAGAVPPASTAVYVAGLVEEGVLLEISGTAVLPDRAMP